MHLQYRHGRIHFAEYSLIGAEHRGVLVPFPAHTLVRRLDLIAALRRS